jgi:hypothetical protein
VVIREREMTIHAKTLKNLERYGDLHIEKFLAENIKARDDILTKRLGSIVFCLSKFIDRGQRDNLSEAFEIIARDQIRLIDDLDAWALNVKYGEKRALGHFP